MGSFFLFLAGFVILCIQSIKSSFNKPIPPNAKFDEDQYYHDLIHLPEKEFRKKCKANYYWRVEQ